jgi:hypothetical protein
MKIVRRSTRHHNNKKLSCSDSAESSHVGDAQNRSTRHQKNSATRNPRTSKPWTPHPTFTFYARRTVKMIKASIPASWLACFCIKEKLVLKSDQGISAYFFRCYLIVTVTGNMIFKLILLESNRGSQHEGMSAKHVSRHGELENRLARPQQFFPCSESASASPTCEDSSHVGMRKIGRRDIENIYRARIPQSGILAPRSHALPTKHIHSMLAIPPPSSRAPELPPLDSEHAECLSCLGFLVSCCVFINGIDVSLEMNSTVLAD